MKTKYLPLVSLLCMCAVENANAAKGGIGAIFGALIGGAAGNAIGKASTQGMTIDEAIVKMTNELNKQMPMTVDRDTRLDGVSPGVGRQFTYNYTFVNSNSYEFDQAAWYIEVSPILRNRVCTNTDMAVFFKNGVTVSYSYKGKDGGHVGKISIAPRDCGFNT